MSFYIKELPDNTAILMTEHGHVIWIFPSVEDAEAAAEDCDEIAEHRNKKGFVIKAVA